MASGGSSAEMVSSNVGGRRSAVVIGVSSMHGMSKDEKKSDTAGLFNQVVLESFIPKRIQYFAVTFSDGS